MKVIYSFLLIALCLIVGCSRSQSSSDSDGITSNLIATTVGKAQVVVDNVTKTVGSDGLPRLTVILKNQGSSAAYGLTCTVKFYRTNVEVLDKEAPIGDQLPGLTLISDGKTVFQIIIDENSYSDHSFYDTIKYDFSWQEKYTETLKSTAIGDF